MVVPRLRAVRGWSAAGSARALAVTVLVTMLLGVWACAPAGAEGASRASTAAESKRASVSVDAPEPEVARVAEGEESEESEEHEDAQPEVREPPVDSTVCSERHRIRPAEDGSFVRHEAVPRESLAQIAHRYDVSLEKLREWNDLAADTERLRKGAKLRIRAQRISPPRERIDYVVQPGDTWWRVAVSHGVDSMDLRSYNWPYRGKMNPGETLQIWVDPLIRDWIAASPGGPLNPDQTVRRGAVGIGSPNEGSLLNGVKIPEGPGYRLRFSQSAYGTTHAVEQFLTAMEIFTEGEDVRPRIPIGSMSRPRGGPLGTHQSHQTGRDLDVRLPRRADAPAWGALKPSRVDWEAAWRLVQAFAQTDVEVIFFDYRLQRRIYKAAQASGATAEELARVLQVPRGRHARRGLVRHADGHDKHFHVRFRCGPCEVECI